MSSRGARRGRCDTGIDAPDCVSVTRYRRRGRCGGDNGDIGCAETSTASVLRLAAPRTPQYAEAKVHRRVGYPRCASRSRVAPISFPAASGSSVDAAVLRHDGTRPMRGDKK